MSDTSGSGTAGNSAAGNSVSGSNTEPQAAPDIAIVGGNPTPEEVAAVTAVLSAVLEELSGELGRATSAGPSAWERSQRDVRAPLYPGRGVWRGFSA